MAICILYIGRALRSTCKEQLLSKYSVSYSSLELRIPVRCCVERVTSGLTGEQNYSFLFDESPCWIGSSHFLFDFLKLKDRLATMCDVFDMV